MTPTPIQQAVAFVAASAARREKKRMQKQRERERQRQRAEMSAKMIAEQQETLAEHLAPKVLRFPIVDRNNHMIVGPRIVIEGQRAIRNDPLANIKLPAQSKRAARRLLMDWNDVGCGVGVGAMDYLRSGGGSGDGLGGHTAMLAQIEARRSLEGAMTFLGALTPVVSRVVLDGIPAWVYAQETATESDAVIAMLRVALARLALFYWPEPRAASGEVQILTFGPARSAYEVEIEGDCAVAIKEG